MHKSALIVSLLLLSCRRRVEAIADPTPEAAVREPAVSKLVRDGELLDLDAGTARTLARARAQVVDESTAYVLDEKHTLRAFQLADGSERWQRAITGMPSPFVLSSGASVAVLREPDLLVFDKKSGDVRTVKLGDHLGHAAATARGFAISRLKSVLTVDESLAVTTTVLPFEVLGYRAALYPLRDRQTVCAMQADVALNVACLGGKTFHVDLRAPSAPTSSAFNIIAVDDQYALYGTQHRGGGLRRVAIVRLADAMVIRLEDQVAAVALRPDGAIEGLLVVDPELRLLDLKGHVRWSAKAPERRENAFAVARDGRLFVALYSEFSTGSTLYAYDLQNGTLLWTGDVERLSIGHSEYRNEVSLSFHRDRVVLAGDESGLTTTQVFSAATGKRVFAFSHYAR